MTSFLLQDFSFSSTLFGSLQTSYGGCINPPFRSIQENVSTAPFSERNVPIKTISYHWHVKFFLKQLLFIYGQYMFYNDNLYLQCHNIAVIYTDQQICEFIICNNLASQSIRSKRGLRHQLVKSFHFINEKMETQKSDETWGMPHGKLVVEPALELRFPNFKSSILLPYHIISLNILF